MTSGDYTPAEGKARSEIDQKLTAASWVVQTRPQINLYDGPGQAVRDFTLKDGHGRVDYLLFVDQKPVGTVEAKPAGTTLTEVELQSLLYTTGLLVEGVPDGLHAARSRTTSTTGFTSRISEPPQPGAAPS